MTLHKLPLIMIGTLVIAMPGMGHAAEPLTTKALSSTYLPGTPPEASKCSTYDSKKEGLLGNSKSVTPCPTLQQSQPPGNPAPENLVDRALVDSLHAAPQNASLNNQPLLDNTVQPNAAALENRGNVLLFFPTVTTQNQQGGSGAGTTVQTGPGGTLIQLRPFR